MDVLAPRAHRAFFEWLPITPEAQTGGDRAPQALLRAAAGPLRRRHAHLQGPQRRERLRRPAPRPPRRRAARVAQGRARGLEGHVEGAGDRPPARAHRAGRRRRPGGRGQPRSRRAARPRAAVRGSAARRARRGRDRRRDADRRRPLHRRPPLRPGAGLGGRVHAVLGVRLGTAERRRLRPLRSSTRRSGPRSVFVSGPAGAEHRPGGRLPVLRAGRHRRREPAR